MKILMIRILGFILLLHSALIGASTNLNFSYSPVQGFDSLSEKLKVLKILDQQFPNHKLALIPQPFLIDGIFQDFEDGKSILVKTGFTPSHSNLLNKVLEVEKGFLFHTQTPDGYPLALLFIGHTRSEIELFYLNLSSSSKKPLPSVWEVVNNLVMPSAHAEDCAPKQSPLLNYLEMDLKKDLSCTIGFFKGVWDSTGGAAVGVTKAILHPVQSAQDVWDGAQKFWSGLQKFQKDFVKSFEALYGSIKNLPPEKYEELKCRIVGAIGTGALVTYFTAGAAGPVMVSKITSLFKKLGITVPAAKVAAALTPTQTLSELFGKSKGVRYFNGIKESRITKETLTPGMSYTVVIYKDKIILGEKVLEDGSTNGTHPFLMGNVRAPDPHDFLDEGGSIRVNHDGSIDVSGYHKQHKSPEAANLIAEKIRLISPNTHLTITGDRLPKRP